MSCSLLQIIVKCNNMTEDKTLLYNFIHLMYDKLRRWWWFGYWVKWCYAHLGCLLRFSIFLKKIKTLVNICESNLFSFFNFYTPISLLIFFVVLCVVVNWCCVVIFFVQAINVIWCLNKCCVIFWQARLYSNFKRN